MAIKHEKELAGLITTCLSAKEKDHEKAFMEMSRRASELGYSDTFFGYTFSAGFLVLYHGINGTQYQHISEDFKDVFKLEKLNDFHIKMVEFGIKAGIAGGAVCGISDRPFRDEKIGFIGLDLAVGIGISFYGLASGKDQMGIMGGLSGGIQVSIGSWMFGNVTVT